MILRLLFLFGVFSATFSLASAQTTAKKTLDHSDFDSWKEIQQPQISNDGRWVVYELNPDIGDGKLMVHDANTNKDRAFDRGKNAKISADSRFVIFHIKPFEDTLKAQRRRKVERDDLPKDSLGILDLTTGNVTRIPQVQSFQMPAKWSGWVAYLREPAKTKTDTTAQKDNGAAKKAKKESKDNGSTLVIRNLPNGQETTVPFVKSYAHAEEGMRFALVSTGDDAEFLPGVYLFDGAKGALQPVFTQKGNYQNLTFDKKGVQLAFVADLDTTKTKERFFGLYCWREGQDAAQLVADRTANFLPPQWRISESAALRFSKDAARLMFGIAPPQILQDTSLLEEEIVNVEVWAYDDPVLPTIQNARLEQEKKRSYECVWHINANRIVQIATESVPEVQIGNEGQSPYAIGFDTKPYGVAATWEWWNKRDVYLIDVESGSRKLIGRGWDGFGGNSGFSPEAKYLYWFSNPDTAWFVYSVETGALRQLTDNKTVKFYDELDDHPNDPPSYGLAGWLKGDAALLVYDRYDIWRIDPTGRTEPMRLTNGRKDQRRIRYLRIDDEKRSIEPGERILVSTFDEVTKRDGYAWLELSNNTLTQLQFDDYRFSNRPLKAKNAERWVFTRESFQVFPDLLYSPDLKTFKQISNANPQQREYRWGTAELMYWTSLDGELLTGMLFKPENFDPKQQYPMIVYFYERSSDGLHQHRAPEPPRSSINYTFYTSKGYVVFVPDIPYKIGYPGESCYNAVIPGVTALIDKGFINRKRIGVQGHSWGGYQIAYLLTRTNIFRCAESGAPVVNMFSAYGGIRWGTGLSRSAQYERTQSRIGGSIWQYPLRFIENSPLFSADKVNTPVLILHNDKDDAVPWYQGIEFYIAMRRLGKPAWLLNYNGEPHGIVKRQNRMDFNRRMQQFFDHYLLDAPKPQWMERGVPAIEKGIRQGLELLVKYAEE